MSMFRRPGDSSSSDEETSSSHEETSAGAEVDLLSRINTVDSTSSAPLSLQPGLTPPPSRPEMTRTNTNSQVRDLLLHSLLEEKALTQAAAHLGKSQADPDVLALARQTYQGLSRQFSGQVDDTYAREDMRLQRAAAKEGIEQATRKQMSGLTATATATGTAAAAEASHALVTRPSFLGISFNASSTGSHEMEIHTKLYQELPPSVKCHTSIHSDRYVRDYEEIQLVGKGGYGKVFKVRNKLDGALYAVKRITISANKLQKIREHGDEELQTILDEVRSLARFEHPNIVRYHGAWMEFSAGVANVPDSLAKRVTRPDRLLEDASEASFSESVAERSYASFSGGIDDPFERTTLEGAGYIHFENSDTGPGVDESDREPERYMLQGKGKGRLRRGSQATIATISSTKSRLSAVEDVEEEEEGDIETIPRTHSPTLEESESILTDSDIPQQLIPTHVPGPVLTLNIQMSLYDSNLAAFLSTDEQDTYTHCFHPCISLELLSKIIKGVEYLHESDVVHRDLKPANVFLSFSLSRKAPSGSVNLSSCRSCSERECLHVTPRIGDFGLVAAKGLAATKPVGTEFYRPVMIGKVDEKLDVFALGVVGFEMLSRFGTRMERVEALTKLRGGEFMEGFPAGCGDFAPMVKRMIGGMVAAEEDERWSCEEVRSEIVKIVGGLKV